VLALENAIYSVISPEGCASILWRAPERAQEAAVAMRLTAAEQQELGVIDEVVPEPGEGAHTNVDETARRLRPRIVHHLDTLAGRDRRVLVDNRYARYRRMGEFDETIIAAAARPERHGLTDRLRSFIEGGRGQILGGDGAPLRPGAADDEPPLGEEV
jgi:enoyl-CoA hydratase/carnithine racemase